MELMNRIRKGGVCSGMVPDATFDRRMCRESRVNVSGMLLIQRDLPAIEVPAESGTRHKPLYDTRMSTATYSVGWG